MTQRFAHHCTIARCVMLLSMAVLLLWIAQPAQAARQGRYAPLIRKAHTWPAKRVVAAGDRHSSARYSAIFAHFIALFSPYYPPEASIFTKMEYPDLPFS